MTSYPIIFKLKTRKTVHLKRRRGKLLLLKVTAVSIVAICASLF